MQIKRILALLIVVISISSFKFAPANEPKGSPEKMAAVNSAIAKANADGKISNKELRNIATIAKGESLSLKEKVALKVFGKKIGTKLSEASNAEGSGKSQIIALILVALVGGLGIHRFYLGYTWQGVVQLLTLGGCGVWALIDLIRIIMGTLKPKGGEYEKTL